MTLQIEETRDIAACRALRRTVFIEEQGVSEADEVDDQDEAAIHLLLTEGGQSLGTARLLIGAGFVKLGRVCVLNAARRKGHGGALIRAAVARARAMPGITEVRLGAQTHALGFYAALGFAARGPVFDDAGIPHREMTLRL